MITHTERLRLEVLSESHANAMLSTMSDARIYTYIPETPYQTVEALQARYRRLVAGSSSPDEIWWNFIVFRQESTAPIGYVQATLMPQARLAEVAYVLSPIYWGNGYATEALGWLLQQIAQRDDIDIVQAQIDERNFASISVVNRLGFKFNSTLVEESSTDSIFQRTLVDFALYAASGGKQHL